MLAEESVYIKCYRGPVISQQLAHGCIFDSNFSNTTLRILSGVLRRPGTINDLRVVERCLELHELFNHKRYLLFKLLHKTCQTYKFRHHFESLSWVNCQTGNRGSGYYNGLINLPKLTCEHFTYIILVQNVVIYKQKYIFLKILEIVPFETLTTNLFPFLLELLLFIHSIHLVFIDNE